MELSPRLEKILFYLPTVQTLADIGTDHGKIPVEAVLRGKAKKAIATDKSYNSLEKARELVAAHRLQGKILLRTGDGIAALRTGEAECIVIAGLGGSQMIKMLDFAGPIWANAKLVLQPNRDVEKVREWLHQNDVILSTESLVTERGRFYNVLVGHRGPAHMQEMAYYVPGWRAAELHIVSPHLLREGGADIQAYYKHLIEKAKSELKKMPKAAEGRAEATARLETLERALAEVS